MKRKLLALALSSTSVVSFADVTLYGKVATGIEDDQFQNTTQPGGGSVQDYGSYFGLRGSDSVYGETSAIWQVEQFLDLTSGQAYSSTTGGGLIVPNPNGSSTSGRVTANVNTLASSVSYLGLQGAWGRVRFGNLNNYVRENMGQTDMFNYNNGVNGMGKSSRVIGILPDAVEYNSPTWSGWSFGGTYSFNNSGQASLTNINSSNSLTNNLNGYYSGGVYSIGLGFQEDNYTVNLTTQVWQNVGTYATSNSGMSSNYSESYPDSTYNNAYATRLEFAYNDPDGLIANVGLQATDGLGWNSWANSGGSWGNFIYNGTAPEGLDSAEYQTQEIFGSLGYHLGAWTPKIGYGYGADMMYGGNLWTVATGTASTITSSGYQQVAAELDWNITPRTIAFIGFGQVWYGSTLQNVAYVGDTSTTTTVDASNRYQTNQSTYALGFSHTF